MKDKKVHMQVIISVAGFAADNGFEVLGLDFSPIKGPEGNIEYLMYIKKASGGGSNIGEDKVQAVVDHAHDILS